MLFLTRLQSMVHVHKCLLFTFDLSLGVMVAQYPIHHVTYAPEEFEVVLSNGLGDAFKRKYII